MKLTRRTHLEIRVQNWIYLMLCLAISALLAWLSQQYNVRFDWTQARQHTLSEASLKVLREVKGSIRLTVFMREVPEARKMADALIDRYNAACHCLTVEFLNPDTHPDRVRALNIRADGETLAEYEGRSEQFGGLDEGLLTSAIQRLLSPDHRRVVFLEGHGERLPEGRDATDYQTFVTELQKKGIASRGLNLALTGAVPEDTDVLVIAGPRLAILPGEMKLIEHYLAQGGSLLWMTEPSVSRPEWSPLFDQFGLSPLPGVVVDASTQLLGIDDPTFALVVDYPPQAMTRGFQQMTLFPTAGAFQRKGESSYEGNPLLVTLERSWTERGPVTGKISLEVNQGEQQGPLDIGFVLTRMPEQKPVQDPGASAAVEQRVVVIGDSDFLSNSHLGQGGNLEFGIRLFQWLTHADSLIEIPRVATADRKIDLSPVASGTIAVVFLILLPLGFLSAGGWIWYRRRQR